MVDRSARSLGQAGSYTITAYPYYMKAVTPSDTVDMPQPGFVRADAAGAVTFIPQGNADNETITQNLVAGEIIKCMVRRVLDTGTDAITLHVSY